jgi:hypothetical protein
MTDFFQHFFYSNDYYISVQQDTVDNAAFYQSEHDLSSLPPDRPCWFGPAMRKTKGNKKEDIAGTIALWADVDGESPFMSTLPPSLLVKSGGGWHAYWLLGNPIEDVDAIERLNKILVADVPGGDASCYNANRILRVPGTINTKYEPPRTVLLHTYQPEIFYTVADIEILERLPDVAKHKIRTGDSRGYRSRSERDWAIIVALVKVGASDQLIKMLFGKQPCGDKARLEAENYLEHTLQKAREEHKPTVLQTKGGTGTAIIEGDDGFYVTGRSTRRITTFLFEPELLLDGHDFGNEDAIVGKVSAEGFEWPNVTFGRAAFTSVSKLDSYLPVAAWQFLDTEQSLRALLPYLMGKLQAKGLPKVKATNTLGLHKVKGQWMYLGNNQTLSATEMWDGFTGPIAWLPVRREHATLDLKPNAQVEYVQQLMQTVSQLNDPEAIWPIIGWYTMSCLKPAIEECGYRFPILNIAGTRGSGKTTLILRVFMKMFGQTDPKSYDAGTTRFVTLSLMGSSNAVPVAFSEFRYDAVLSFVRYILLSYDTGHDPRGRPDQTTVDYALSAPFSIDGEDVVEDPAAKERLIISILHPQSISELSAAYRSMGRFRELFGTNPGGYIIQRLLGKVPSLLDTLKQSHAELTEAFPIQIPDRVRRNYTVAWTGIKWWCDIAGMDLPDVKTLQSSIDQIYDTVTGRSKTLADFMVEDIANAASSGTQGFRFTLMNEGTELWFQMASAHNYWATSRRRQGRAALERDAIRNQIKEATYFIEARAIDGVWMFGIDLQKAFDTGLDLPSHINLASITVRF